MVILIRFIKYFICWNFFSKEVDGFFVFLIIFNGDCVIEGSLIFVLFIVGDLVVEVIFGVWVI